MRPASRFFLFPKRLCALANLALALLLGTTAAAFADGNVSDAIRVMLAQGSLPQVDAASLDLTQLRRFYAGRNDAPAWSGNETQASAALSALGHADDEGLLPSDYHVANVTLAPTTIAAEAERDILLTDSVLRYARDLHVGRPDLRQIDTDIDLPTQPFDSAAALQNALQSNHIRDFLAALPPGHPEYARLRQALATYRKIASSGGWPTLAAIPGTGSGTEIAIDPEKLRQRLAFEDASLDPADSTSGSLIDAIKRFQSRHGLIADGIIGPGTLAELNVPADERVLEIETNMERWRWLGLPLEADRIVVNVPDAKLEAFKDDASVLVSRVIVGRRNAPTPILRAVAVAVTINPPWNVPSRIAYREILSKLRRHRDYLRSQNMILVGGPADDPQGLRVPWKHMKTMPWHVRQLPGPKNALGQVKLELPNRFDVYLHDTPARSAFDLDNPYLSHGCVRVQQILPLASFALSGDAKAAQTQLLAAIGDPVTQHFQLSHPLPVYLLYWTTFVDADGSVEFRPDIYDRDEELIAAMQAHAVPEKFAYIPGQCEKA